MSSEDARRKLMKRFYVHILLSYFGVVAGAICGLVLAGVLETIGLSFLARFLSEPYWLAEIIVGFIFGLLAYQRVRSTSVWFAWIPPAVFLFGNMWWERTMLGDGATTLDNYFTAHCHETECLYELFLTAPFYTSVAYTAGAFAAWTVKKVRVKRAASIGLY